jgi:hypothetical protein
MKKVFSLLIAIVVLASAFSFSASKAQAAGLITFADGRFVWGKGIVFLFDASGIKNKDLKGANIFAGSDYHKLYCSFNKEEGRIVCVVSGGLTEFAGQTGVIYLAGQIFYVTIPDRALHSGTDSEDETCSEEDEECEEPENPGEPGGPGDPGNPPEACIPPDVLGADVEFVDGEDVATTEFVPGETMAEVSANATQMLFGLEGWETFQIAGPLECGMTPQ